MAQTPNAFLEVLRQHRSSEGNFDTIQRSLDEFIQATKESNANLADDLQQTKDKYGPAYTKAKETGGTAWPEFEKFISEIEKRLTSQTV